jgi:hypothetical protein
VHYENSHIIIRANGSIAPQRGLYTVNNYLLYFRNSALFSGNHYYKASKNTPDSFKIGFTNEEESKIKIQDGILVSSNTSDSCLGASGDNVTIVEIPIDYGKYLGTN